MIKGMNRYSGRTIVDDIQLPAHLLQSTHDILTTLKGTRLCRRNYGSLLPNLIDQPCNEITQLQIMNASASSIIEFEPRVKVSSVMVSGFKDQIGYWEVTISGQYQALNGVQKFQQPFSLGRTA